MATELEELFRYARLRPRLDGAQELSRPSGRRAPRASGYADKLMSAPRRTTLAISDPLIKQELLSHQPTRRAVELTGA